MQKTQQKTQKFVQVSVASKKEFVKESVALKKEKGSLLNKKVAAPAKGKGKGKGMPGDCKFHDEVDRILVKHWGVEEPAKCIKWDYNRVYKVNAPQKGQTYIVKARQVGDKNSQNKMKVQEETQMKFVDFLASKNVPCGGYVSPGVLTLDKIQIMVTQLIAGERISSMQLNDKKALTAVGDYLAQFHEGSRMFSKQFPDSAVKFPKWNEGQWLWQKEKLTPPKDSPMDELNYGLIHADFHPGNWHIYKTTKRSQLLGKESEQATTASDEEETKEANTHEEFQVGAFDWDNVQHCWFLVDLGCVVFEAAWTMAREAKTMTEFSTLVKRQQETCDWLIQAYEKKTQELGHPEYKVDREHLRACCDMRRDFVRQVFEWWIPGAGDRKAWLQDYVDQVKQGHFQHYEVCRLTQPKGTKKYLSSLK